MNTRHAFPAHLDRLQLARSADDGTWLIRAADGSDWAELNVSHEATSRDAIRTCRGLARDWASTTATRPADTPLGPPAFRPGKIVAVAANYAAHAAEVGLDTRGDLVLFAKFPTSLTGPTDTIQVDRAISGEVDYETELAIVMGHTIGPHRTALPMEQAVFGLTVANDISARDIQRRGNRLTHAKSLDTFLPLGPWVTRLPAHADMDDLRITTWVNGAIRQDSSTSHMRRDVRTLLAEISDQITLEPGDIVLTGSPAGSAAGMTSPQFLSDGDVLESEIAGLGRMRNIVAVH